MSSTENKRKELEHILTGGNFVKITGAIKAMREEPPFSGAINLLISFYNDTDNDSIKRLIRDFMNDLRDQASCTEVVEELRKDLKAETMRMAISSCWQSGLDYSDFSEVFAELFLSSDYMTAIECFTVIESNADRLERSKKDELIRIINEGISTGTGDKRSLALELISVLE
ncbi:MAG: hypothetical protein GX431_13600 [Bacteroidales bacterium]|jgi:hypothetical protein|nr:hypothetical protein [Bacteroidales bacterium]